MAIKFEGIKKFEDLVTRGLYEFTPEIREQIEAKAVYERRFARWCDEHQVGETYEDGVKALYDFYEDLERKEDKDKDKHDIDMLEAWIALHDSTTDEDASD